MSAMRSASSSDDDGDVVELDVAVLDEVGEAAGAGHDDVDAAAEGPALGPKPTPP